MIRVRCQNCGPVDIGPIDITIEGQRYRFICRLCGRAGSGLARPGELALLVAIGVRTEAAAPDRHPLVEGDVEAFRQLLDSDRWFDDLARMIDVP